MKKYWIAALCLVLCLALTGCGSKDAPAGNAAEKTEATITTAPTAEPQPAFEPLDWSTVQDTAADQFSYAIVDFGKDDVRVEITGYLGSDPIVKIPAEIEGHRVYALADDLFRASETLTHVYLPDSIGNIGVSCFNYCRELLQVRLPAEIYEITEYAFKDCVKLRKVDFPTNVTIIGTSAFECCESLEEAVLPETVTTLEQAAFVDCTALKVVAAPGLKQLGQRVFAGCRNLSDLTLHAGCNVFNGNALNDCISLTDLTLTPVPEGYTYSMLVYEDGIIYKKSSPEDTEVEAMRMLPGYPAGQVVLNPNTTILEHSVFYGCSLTSIEIPAGVGKIEGNAFKDCVNLESVTFAAGSTLNTIGSYAFYHCPKLLTIDLSFCTERLQLSSYAFAADYELTSVKLPNDILAWSAGDEIFAYSEKVTVSYRGTDYTFDKLAELVFE